MLRFMTSQMNRTQYRRGRASKIARAEDESSVPGEVVQSTISYATMEGYANALMHLWNQQQVTPRTSNHEVLTRATPVKLVRPDSVRALLDTKKRAISSDEDKNLLDRAKGTMIDCIDSGKSELVYTKFWDEHSENGLKYRANQLLEYAFCSRGDNIRKLKLSTIGVIHFPDEGIEGASLLRAVWRKSKKNQYGHNEETTAMR